MTYRFLIVFIIIAVFTSASSAQTNFDTSGGVGSGTGTGTAGSGSFGTGGITDSGGGTVGAGNSGAGGVGGSCDFTALKKSIQSTESARGCAQRGPMTKYGRAQGKYQFIPGTWTSMVKTCANADQCAHGSDAFFSSATCCQVQECAMDNLLASNRKAISKKASCQQILGKNIKSPKYGSCTVTEAGILAAWHLGGNNACDGVARGTYGDSDGHTTEADYMCRHGKAPIPGNCTPSTDTASETAPPVGTLQQIETQTAQAVNAGEEPTIIVGDPDALRNYWVGGLMLMAEQFTVNMEVQVGMIGTFLDAKQQLETQRLFQQMSAKAHKDYQPSEQMCTFGTFTRDLAATERTANVTKAAISGEILKRDLGAGDAMGQTVASDTLSRMGQFRKRFCNPKDNANGLAQLCPTAGPPEMQNADVNYTQALDQPLSLKINLADDETTTDEEMVFALIDNLFAHDPVQKLPKEAMDQRKFQYHYMNLRSLIAMRGIARNSIAGIIAQKTATPNKNAETASPFMRALLREFGLQDEEITKLIGENPSYYAQMELLTKKMYQSPTFYTNLYDKPANVKRIRAAMQAIRLMQDRDIQSALHRREALMSMLLEIRLRNRAVTVYDSLERSMFEAQ